MDLIYIIAYLMRCWVYD